MLAALRQSLSRQLVGRTTAARVRSSAPSVAVLPGESTETPEILRMPLSPEAQYLARPVYESGEARCFELSGVYLDTYLNLVLTRGRRIVAESDNIYREYPHTHPSEFLDWRKLYGVRATAIPGLVAPLRSAANNYYHALVDTLPRLFALHHPAFAGRTVKLLVAGELQPWEAYFLPRLLPDNVEIHQVARNALFAPEACVLPSFLSSHMAGYLPRRYLEFFHPRVLPQRSRRGARRIYVTRRNARVGRRVRNEEQVSAFLERRGFETAALEDLSIAEQIELFYDAHLVVGPHGAGLANLLFAHSAGLLELHPARTIYPHYYLLCRGLGHAYRYLCGDGADRNSDFTVEIGALAAALDELEAATPAAR